MRYAEHRAADSKEGVNTATVTPPGAVNEAEGKAPLPTRIGIHTGEAIVGNIGANKRMNYSVIGDSVNLASRLEGTNKIYGTRIIISQSVYDRASERFICRSLDLIAVKGKAQGVMIYELVGRRDDDGSTEKREFAEMFSRAIQMCFKQNWGGAIEMFSDIHDRFPSDRATSLYIDRCKQFQQDPPASDWNGITYLDSK